MLVLSRSRMSKTRELECAAAVEAAEPDFSFHRSEYYGTISIGTSDFNVILDTGSTDLLIATSGCSGCESSTPAYDSSTSSTSDVSSTAFSITYVRLLSLPSYVELTALQGTGSASGVLVTDTVSIAGYSVRSDFCSAFLAQDPHLCSLLSNQTFAACDTINNIVSGSISGLLGLG